VLTAYHIDLSAYDNRPLKWRWRYSYGQVAIVASADKIND
jgi:hypothetical protein